jgi:hypothetical protein
VTENGDKWLRTSGEMPNSALKIYIFDVDLPTSLAQELRQE